MGEDWINYIKLKLEEMSDEDALYHPESKRLIKSAAMILSCAEYIEARDKADDEMIMNEIETYHPGIERD